MDGSHRISAFTVRLRSPAPLLLLVPFLLLLSLSCPVDAVVFQDFEACEDGALPTGWKVRTGGAGSVVAASHRLRIVDADTSQTYAYYSFVDAPGASAVTVDFDLRRESGAARIALGTPSTTFANDSVLQIVFRSDGSVAYYTGSTYAIPGAGTIPAGTTVHVRITLEYGGSGTGTTKLYLDGALVPGTYRAIDWSLRGKLPTSLMLGSNTASGTGDDFTVDDVRIATEIEPPASLQAPAFATSDGAPPVTVTHATTGGGADLDFCHVAYRYDASLDRLMRVALPGGGAPSGAVWEFPLRTGGTYLLGTEVRLHLGSRTEDARTDVFDVPAAAWTVSAEITGSPADALRLTVAGGLGGLRTMAWIRRAVDPLAGWTLVKAFEDPFTGSDGATHRLDVPLADLAAWERPAAGETLEVRIGTVTEAQYLDGLREPSGVRTATCVVRGTPAPSLADVLVQGASSRDGSWEPLEATLVRPAGGTLRFRATSAGFQGEDVNFTLSLLPDAMSGAGAGAVDLDQDSAFVGTGERTTTLEWDTSATPSGTYLVSIVASPRDYLSAVPSATRLCVVTLTRTGEVLPRLDEAAPIAVAALGAGRYRVTLQGTQLESAYATLAVHTASGGLAYAAGLGPSAAALDVTVPGYGYYEVSGTVRRPGLNAADDAAYTDFAWLRPDPVRVAGVAVREGSSSGPLLGSDPTAAPGTTLAFSAAGAGGAGTGPQASAELAEGYEYAFWTEDSGDWRRGRGWSASPDWSTAFPSPGRYRVIVLVRGADGRAGSCEARWETTVLVSGAPDMGAYRLVRAVGLLLPGVGATGAEQPDGSLSGIVARVPVRLAVEEIVGATDAQGRPVSAAARPERRLYRFEAMGRGLHVVLRGWSPDPTCLWIPRRTGSFVVLVHVRDAGSGGYEDVATFVAAVAVGE